MERMNFYYVIIENANGISLADIVKICHMLHMHNLTWHFETIKVWLVGRDRIEKLGQILDILGVEYRLAEDFNNS